jgi:hypothetical protein
MLELLVRLRRTRSARLPVDEVDVGTSRALVHRGLARFEHSPVGEDVVLTALGRRHVDAARALKLPRWAA